MSQYSTSDNLNNPNKDTVIEENPVISISTQDDDNDSDNFEYDNNPFLGTTHLFASGIHNINSYATTTHTSAAAAAAVGNNNNLLTPTRPQYLYDSDHVDSINKVTNNLDININPSSTSLNSSSSSSSSSTPPSNFLTSSPSSSSSTTNLINSNNIDPSIPNKPFSNTTNPNTNSDNNVSEVNTNISSNTTTDLEPFENLSISMTSPYQNTHMTINQYTYNKDNNVTTKANNIIDYEGINNNTNILDASLKDQIVIIGSGEYNDPWGKHAIGYIIRSKSIDANTGQIIDQEVTRRYSEFFSLYQVLIKLLPTVMIPPIPSKHSIFKYFLNPINAKNDQRIISMRRRRLMAFLNHCNKIEEIHKLSVFQKFLDPNYLWKDVLNSPPISLLPNNNLLAPPLNVTKPSPLHLLLPSPTSSNSVNNYNDTMNKFLFNQNMSMESIEKFHLNDFNRLESQINQYLYSLQPILSKIKNNKFHIHSLSSQFAELGAYYNALSLETSSSSLSSSVPIESFKQLQIAIEKVGHSYDVNYVTLEILIENLANIIEEPLDDLIKFIKDSKRIIMFKNLKFVQYQIIINTIHRRKSRLNELKNFENKMQRLDMALKRDAISSPTIANAIKNMNAQNITTDSDINDNTGVTSSKKSDSTSQSINDSQLLIQLQLQKNKKRLNKRKNKLKNKFDQIDPEFLTKLERDEEIEKLNKELVKLRDCESLIKLDLQQVIESTLKNLNYLIMFIKRNCHRMLKDMTKAILNWIKECLTTWRQTKAKIDCI